MPLGFFDAAQFADFAEMMAVNRKGHRQREQTGPMEKSPQQELPVLESLSAENTKADD
jgi:hypothetical protein